jgi:hypothetical protein
MEPFGFVIDTVAANADGRVEEIGEAGLGEELFTRAVSDDAAMLHEDDAIDFRQNIAEVVCDEDEASAFLREAAHGFPQIALRGKV